MLILCVQTILLQNRQKKNYCVSCQELDSDIDKDNPGTTHTLIQTFSFIAASYFVSKYSKTKRFFPFTHTALNAQAALSQVRERQLATQPHTSLQDAELTAGPSTSTSSNSSQASVSVPRPEHCEGAAAGGRNVLPPPAVPPPLTPASTPVLPPPRPSVSPQSTAVQHVLQDAEEAILSKLRWATTQLQSAASLEASIQLCSLITSCASSLRSLRDLSQ